jgi:hypothetical protein
MGNEIHLYINVNVNFVVDLIPILLCIITLIRVNQAKGNSDRKYQQTDLKQDLLNNEQLTANMCRSFGVELPTAKEMDATLSKESPIGDSAINISSIEIKNADEDRLRSRQTDSGDEPG